MIDDLAEEIPGTRYHLINWFLSDGSEVSLEQFVKTVQEFESNSDYITHVLVKNLGRSTEDVWSHPAIIEALKPVNGWVNVRQTVFPRFYKPEGFDGMVATFAEVMTKDGKGKNKLDLLNRRRVIGFLTDAETNIASLGLLDVPKTLSSNSDPESKSELRLKPKSAVREQSTGGI